MRLLLFVDFAQKLGKARDWMLELACLLFLGRCIIIFSLFHNVMLYEVLASFFLLLESCRWLLDNCGTFLI